MMNMFNVDRTYHKNKMEKGGMINTHASKVNKFIEIEEKLDERMKNET